MSSRKAGIVLSAVLLSMSIMLLAVAVFISGEKPSITGAAVYQPNIPAYCYSNVDACINLNGDSLATSADESIFAKILDGTITNATLKHLADFDNNGVVTNSIDFQKCFVPLYTYYRDIYDSRADCNLPKGRFTEPNLSNCMHGCPDLDGNGYVDSDDYLLFKSLRGNETTMTNYPAADMTGDGFIGTEDKSCMSLFYGRIVTCNMPQYFKHLNSCPDLTDEFDVGNDGYVDDYDLGLFNNYSLTNNLKADFNWDGSVNEADRVIFNKYYGMVVDCDIYHAPWHVGGMHQQNIKLESTYALFGGKYNLSQSFVANCQHGDECQLTKIRLHLKNMSGNPSEVFVKVYDSNSSGGPNQTYVIATTSLTPSFEFNKSRWVTIPFNNPPMLEKNKKYHLVVSSPGSSNQSYAWYYNDVLQQNITLVANASWHGEGPNNASGFSVAAGDINKDGYDDIIIGAHSADGNKGKVYVIFGPDYSNDNLSNADIKISAEGSGDKLGYSLATGDINKDGYDDIIVSAIDYDVGADEGAVYVVNGPILAGTYNISNIYDTLWYGEQMGQNVGEAIESGDLNNDGYGDLVVGSYRENTAGGNGGAVYVVYGPDYSTNNLSYADVKIYSESAGDYLGMSLSIGDLNNDGLNDLAVGAISEGSGGSNAGAFYVLYSPLPAGTGNISSVYDAKYYGKSAGEYLGYPLAIGDINHDGYKDILAGASGVDKAYVVFGGISGTQKLEFPDITIGGTEYFNYTKIADLDNDGFDDIILSDPAYDAGTDEGVVYVLNGPLGSGTYHVDSSYGTKVYGEQSNQGLESVAVGNFDGDDYNDLLVGGPLYDKGSAVDAGKSYILYSPLPRNVNGSFWNETHGSGWVQDTSSEFLFQLWLSSACADLNDDGVCDAIDEGFILTIPDLLRSSGTEGWKEDYDLNGDGKIDSDDTDFLEPYISSPEYNITVSVSCPVNSTIAPLAFGRNISVAQPFRASQDYVYYVDLYLRKSAGGSGTKDIKVEIRSENGDEPIMSGIALASKTIGPITSTSYSRKRFYFDAPASIVSGGKYFIVATSEASVKLNEYEWMACGNLTVNDQNATVGEFNNHTFLWTFNTSNRNLSFVVYNGNTDSLNASLDINNDKAINSTDFYIINSSVGNWSGDVWSGKVDFNAEFGLYEKLKDYTLGFKAYLDKVVTCGLLNWPEGTGNGRCDIDSPFNENYLSTPQDCPECNYDSFCSISEDPNNCTDCIWDPVVSLYPNRTITWAEDTNKTVNVSDWFSDPDNDSYYEFTYLNASPRITVKLNTAAGRANFTPAANFFGIELVNFSATDTLSTASVIAILNVTNVDDAPYLKTAVPNMTWPEDVVNTSLNISQYFGEYDNENLVYSVSLQPSNINVSINQTTGIVTMTPAGNWSGAGKVRFRAADPQNKYGYSNNVTLNVTPVNDAPYLAAIIPNQSSVMDRNMTINMSRYFADVENDNLNYTAVNGTNVIILINNTNKVVTIVPDSGWNGTSWIIFTANDTASWADSNNVSLYFALGESILINSRIDGVLKANGNYTNLTYVIVSNLTSSNITSSSYLFRSRAYRSYIGNSSIINASINKSTIINSTLIRCNISNSTVKNYYGEDCVITDSEVDPVNQNNVTGSTITGNSRIISSNVTFSRVHNSYISHSNFNNCNFTGADARSSEGEDCVVEYASVDSVSNLTGSSVLNGSGIESSNVTYSVVFNSNITSSNSYNCTINNSYVYGTEMQNCTIINGTITGGFIKFENGTYYDAFTDGSKNLTDIINYPPEVSLAASSTSISPGSSVTFTIDADDANLGGALESDLLHTWYPGLGNANVFRPNAHQTWNRSMAGIFYRVTTDSEDSIIAVGNKSSRFYTAKLDSSGELVWNKTFGSNAGEAYSVAVDSEDNIISAGYNGTSTYAGLIVKYNSSGAQLWNLSYNSSGKSTSFYGVDTDSEDKIIVVGEFYSGADNHSFIIKYNSTGAKLWEENVTSGTDTEYLNDIIIDDNNNIVAMGGHGAQVIIVKYLANGTQLWNTTYSLSGQYDHGIAVDSSGNALAVSHFSDGCFVSKNHKDNGTEIWNLTLDWDTFEGCRDIAVDSEDNILIAAVNYSNNFIVFKFIENVSQVWNITYSSGSFSDTPYGIASDSHDNVIAAGEYDLTGFVLKLKPLPNSPNSTLRQTYSSAGTYNASITVMDAFNETDSDTKSITVSTPSPPPPGRGGGGGRGVAACAESWSCAGWDECTPSGIQFRACTDANACGTYVYKPSESQACSYTPTCDDFVLNQDETDIDCGGSCTPCSDGKSCFADSDCKNKCISGVCAAEAPPAPVARPPTPAPRPRPPVEMPAEIGFLQKEIFGVSMWVVIAGAVAAVILVSGGIFAAARRKKKPAELPSYTYLDSLRTAIKRDIIRGVPETDIRQTLLDMGWPAHIVDQSIKEINKDVLSKPVESSIARGYDEVKLKQALVEKGWPVSTVDDVIRDVNLSILKKSMKNHLAKGKEIEDIKEGMLQRGWPEDTVIEAAEGFNFAK